MSLLLDALKKAAEQKARQAKAGSENSAEDRQDNGYSDADETQSRDDTLVAEDRTIEYEEQTEVSDDDNEVIDDKTVEVTARARTSGDDETERYNQQDTQTHLDDSEFFEDDTHILDDGATVTEAHGPVDETQLDETQLDETQLEETQLEETQLEETQLEEMTDHTAVTEFNEHTAYDQTESTIVDDTVINQEDRTEYSRTVTENMSHGDENDDRLETNIDSDATEPVLTGRDISDFLVGSEDDTDINEDTSISDMSLLLADEHDNTTQYAANKTITTQPGSGDFAVSPEAENLRMVEGDYDSPTRTSTITADQNETVTTGVELESLRHEHTIIRPEVTSTHTYAPDNYDRTLIRPPSDDASRIFAGMKADEDVLMTPDYAKRVFLSKSTANRRQHYLVYLGIAASVLLATGVYSMFEVMDEYQQIDSAMLPLKRDPMPGIIRNNKNKTGQTEVQPDVDMQTLKLVENAQAATASEAAQAADSPASEVANVTDDKPVANDNVEPDSVENISESSETVQTVVSTTVQQKTTETAATGQAASQAENQASGSLQISSSSRLSDIDQWLADAYAAYQRGDDTTALRHYARVLAPDPFNRNALLARAAISVQNGDASAAISDYQLILQANPKDSLAMSSLISVARVAPRESETQLKLLIRDEPDSPYLNFALGNVYGAQNRWQEAQSLYFKALQNKPEDPNYAYNLAVSLEHISQPKTAIIYYERAIANINNGLATFNRALVDSRIAMLKQL